RPVRGPARSIAVTAVGTAGGVAIAAHVAVAGAGAVPTHVAAAPRVTIRQVAAGLTAAPVAADAEVEPDAQAALARLRPGRRQDRQSQRRHARHDHPLHRHALASRPGPAPGTPFVPA